MGSHGCHRTQGLAQSAVSAQGQLESDAQTLPALLSLQRAGGTAPTTGQAGGTVLRQAAQPPWQLHPLFPWDLVCTLCQLYLVRMGLAILVRISLKKRQDRHFVLFDDRHQPAAGLLDCPRPGETQEGAAAEWGLILTPPDPISGGHSAGGRPQLRGFTVQPSLQPQPHPCHLPHRPAVVTGLAAIQPMQVHDFHPAGGSCGQQAFIQHLEAGYHHPAAVIFALGAVQVDLRPAFQGLQKSSRGEAVEP